MLTLMTTLTVTWDELDNVWPWRRVLAAEERARWAKFEAAYPATLVATMYANANRGKGQSARSITDFLLPSVQIDPPAKRRGEATYTKSVIEAFNEAYARGVTGNAHLVAFGLNELRASGLVEERYA